MSDVFSPLLYRTIRIPYHQSTPMIPGRMQEIYPARIPSESEKNMIGFVTQFHIYALCNVLNIDESSEDNGNLFGFQGLLVLNGQPINPPLEDTTCQGPCFWYHMNHKYDVYDTSPILKYSCINDATILYIGLTVTYIPKSTMQNFPSPVFRRR